MVGLGACWLWEGHVNSAGYGQFWERGPDGVRRKVLAHRRAYEIWVGPIPADRQMDHVCNRRRCVNPAHLQLVTCRQNLLRSPKTWARRNKDKTVCLNGHPFDGVDRFGWRECRVCKAERRRQSRRRCAARLDVDGNRLVEP